MAADLFFHGDMRVIDAARVAASQGCVIEYRGGRFVARPVQSSPSATRYRPFRRPVRFVKGPYR
ncbi:MAG: hypothetical protein KIT73_14730 [Burkholderiales bacterium]|nr:hypothetical protein [Burkholderiales bacterium]